MFKERSEKYPTDLRIRFDLGVRRFSAGQFDDAIPLLQSARLDPKNRVSCSMYLGRCFLRKGYYDQAIPALEEALAGSEAADDELVKTTRYWLARAQEGAGNKQAAQETYGNILQADYNYRDVRARLDRLR